MMDDTKARRLLWLMIVVYIVVLGTVSLLRHYQFQTQTWDMGAFVQTFWNTTQGRMMFNNLEEAPNHLGVHMSPILFLLVPGYALFSSPYYLLIVQVLALGLGAWPLYLLAGRVLGNPRWALLVSGAYLVYPSLHWVNLFDFHEIAFFIPALLAAFYFLEDKRWGWAGLFLILAAAAKENAILAVMFVGLWLLIRESRGSRERWVGAVVTVLAVIYFLVSVKVIMPALGGGLLRIDRYTALGIAPGDMLRNVAVDPGLLTNLVITAPKLWYLLWIFLPVALLPLLSWRTLILLVPGLLQNLLTTFEYQFTGFFQYDAILIPAIFLGTIYGLRRVLRWRPARQKLIFRTILATALAVFLLRSPVSPIGFPPQLLTGSERSRNFRAMAQLVPEDVSVAAHTNLVPHLSHRQHGYMAGHEPFAVDMVLLDTTDSFGFFDVEEFHSYVESYISSGRYVAQAVDEQGKYVILVRQGLLNR